MIKLSFDRSVLQMKVDATGGLNHHTVDRLCKEVLSYCSGYRAKEETDVVLDFNPNHSNHASAHGFVGAKVHVNSGQQAAEGLLRDAWGNTMNPKIERARFDNKYYLQPALNIN